MKKSLQNSHQNSHDEILIYPTDTVWGIGCSLYSQLGHNQIADIKKTSKDKPLSIMFSSVDVILKSFDLPKDVTKQWLIDFFKLETTLGIPVRSAKIEIPPWSHGESSFVTLRCLETNVVKEIYDRLGAPFFTTSLNLTGEPPIVEELDAINFQKRHAPSARLIRGGAGVTTQDLSGSSSTIVFIDESGKVEIKREGKRIEDVKNHISQLARN